MPEERPTPSEAGARLDAWLAARRPEHSRARWQKLIRDGHVVVNGAAAPPRHVLREGDVVVFDVPAPKAVSLEPESIPLAVLYEDRDLVVVDKPPGLVVHPAPGHAGGTLVNALLHHCRDLGGIGGELRPGIVHRLDKDTSGALVAAKTEAALAGLVDQFKTRAVAKTYLALVHGEPAPAAGTIRTLVGRSRRDRKKMSASPARGRPAVSHYETIERLGRASLVRVDIETGRTHQIRVQMAHLGHPVLGDTAYGGRRDRGGPPVPRQMLHAWRLAFAHPRTGLALAFEAPVPADMDAVLQALRASSPHP